MAAAQSPRDTADHLIVVVLFLAVVAYLAALPRYLGPADESFFLYEARRIREGDVMYRDFFQFVAPAAWYAMAGLFWLFGTSMATARLSMAVLHAGTAVLLYLTCRRMGVRHAIAALAPIAYVALCAVRRVGLAHTQFASRPRPRARTRTFVGALIVWCWTRLWRT